MSAKSQGLNFRLQEIDGEPEAVFDSDVQTVKTLLTRFLHPAPHFVTDMLYEISLVERNAVQSSGFETALVDVLFSPEGVTITSRFKEIGEDSPAQIVLPVDEAKLLLLEWGAAVLRWRMGKQAG